MTDETRLIRPQSALFGEGDAPLGLDEYQQFTTQTDKNSRAGIKGLGRLPADAIDHVLDVRNMPPAVTHGPDTAGIEGLCDPTKVGNA